MKRQGDLMKQVCADDTLRLAARRARRGKRYRDDVLRFHWREEEELLDLRDALLAGTWCPGPHRHFQITDPKPRWISAAPYADRIVHHAICAVIEPILDRRFIFDSWANRKGKGSHRAVLRYQRFAGRFRYALKCDIRKFFPSIDHAILEARFRDVFKDELLLALLDRVVDHGVVPAPHHAHFAGDDLFTPLERPKGLPIGNLTSQLWGNLYLDSFDHWIKEIVGVAAYLRFVDDFVLLSDSKVELLEWKRAIGASLAAVRLQLHTRKCVIRRVAEGLPFLGYVVWPDRIRVRGETIRRYRRRFREDRRRDDHTSDRRDQQLAAWRGHTKLAGDWRRCAMLDSGGQRP